MIEGKTEAKLTVPPFYSPEDRVHVSNLANRILVRYLGTDNFVLLDDTPGPDSREAILTIDELNVRAVGYITFEATVRWALED